jgi:uncharacterized protein (DUF58 family)
VAARFAPTPTAAVIFFAGVVAIVVALANGNLLAHLIAAIVFAFLAVSAALAARALDGLSVTLAVQATAYDGDDVALGFEVRNAGRRVRSLVEITSRFYASTTPEGSVTALAAEVAPGGTVAVTGEVPGLRRGEHVFEPPTLSSGDPFGLFTVSRSMEESVTPTRRLTVFPRPVPIDYLAIASDLSWSISGLEPTHQAGSSGDFLGTREYRPGDSVRAIHWPLSARMGELIVKEFERNASTEVSIFLDLDAKAAWGHAREHTLEYAVRIAASVSEYATRRGNSVQLVAHASHWITLPPGKGAYHQLMMMHYLAAFVPTTAPPFHFVIGQMAPRLKEGSTAVIIFPSEHLNMQHFGPALEALWTRRIRVTAIIMNVESFLSGQPTNRLADGGPAAYLASRGARVYIVSCGRDLGQQLSVPM